MPTHTGYTYTVGQNSEPYTWKFVDKHGVKRDGVFTYTIYDAAGNAMTVGPAETLHQAHEYAKAACEGKITPGVQNV